jgi:zinc D-Ala-D-Ala carboxypeptidase
MNWDNFPNFTESEFACRHCGKVNMNPEFLQKLQALRTAYAKPMRITSGYRCPDHPVEAQKTVSGAHTSGRAADVAVQGHDAHELLKLAFQFGFTGIGVQQKGTGRFVHLDTLTEFPRPNVWSYP